jgi:hypothetical protein
VAGEVAGCGQVGLSIFDDPLIARLVTDDQAEWTKANRRPGHSHQARVWFAASRFKPGRDCYLRILQKKWCRRLSQQRIERHWLHEPAAHEVQSLLRCPLANALAIAAEGALQRIGFVGVGDGDVD